MNIKSSEVYLNNPSLEDDVLDIAVNKFDNQLCILAANRNIALPEYTRLLRSFSFTEINDMCEEISGLNGGKVLFLRILVHIM